MSRNIILIGFMGVGKTTYGEQLSKIFKMDFIDTDKAIENKEDLTISEIFGQKGESYFRSLEKELISQIVTKENQIVATGGGIIKDEENVAKLKEKGIIVYLKAEPEKIFQNLQGDASRPLLYGNNKLEKIKALLEERVRLYENSCDITVDVSVGSVEHIVKCLVDTLEGVL